MSGFGIAFAFSHIVRSSNTIDDLGLPTFSVWREGMATWRSGDAADCKSVYPGSIPGVASNTLPISEIAVHPPCNRPTGLGIALGNADEPRRLVSRPCLIRCRRRTFTTDALAAARLTNVRLGSSRRRPTATTASHSTRGMCSTESLAPTFPLPLRGRTHDDHIHGFRCAPPVATAFGPSGAFDRTWPIADSMLVCASCSKIGAVRTGSLARVGASTIM